MFSLAIITIHKEIYFIVFLSCALFTDCFSLHGKIIAGLCIWVFSVANGIIYTRGYMSGFSHDVFKNSNERIIAPPEFFLSWSTRAAKTNIFTQIFTLKGFFFSLIHYAWISKLFRDAEFTWRPRDRSTVQVKKVTYIGVIVRSEQSLY